MGTDVTDLTRFFHPVLRSSSLRARPVRVMLGGRPYALFRDDAGQPHALADTCPHRGAPLSIGRVTADGRLQCRYHGWRFDAEGKGFCPSQPRLVCRTESYRVTERFGYLWLTRRDVPESSFPELAPETGGLTFSGVFSILFRAPLHVTLDNFSEDEHLPWVHQRFGWDEDHADQVEFEAKNFEDRTEISYAGVQRPSLPLILVNIRAGDIFHNAWVTRFDPVRATYSFHWTDPTRTIRRPLTVRTTIFMVPETAETTRIHVFNFARYDGARAMGAVASRAAVVLGLIEGWFDARFIRHVSHTPFDMRGMRLNKYDKPLVHHRRLLRSIYWRDSSPGVAAAIASDT